MRLKMRRDNDRCEIYSLFFPAAHSQLNLLCVLKQSVKRKKCGE